MLTVHGENTTVEQLREIPLIRPESAGGQWQGLQHGELVSAILDEARCRKWVVNGSKFSVGARGADIVGAFDLSVPNMPAPDGQTLSMGVVNSNSRKTAPTLLVGTTVVVCTNGMATGEIVLRNKHIKGFDLYDGIEKGFDEYKRKAGEIDKVVAKLKRTRMHIIEVEHALMQAGRDLLMPWSRIGKVDVVYRSKEHQKIHGHGTAWSLLNAFTSIVKQNRPWLQMKMMSGFRALLLGA